MVPAGGCCTFPFLLTVRLPFPFSCHPLCYCCSVLCDFGTFNPGEVASQGHAYGELAVGVAALSPMMIRKRVRGVPQILACQACSARNPQGGFTTLDMGSKFSKQCICK